MAHLPMNDDSIEDSTVVQQQKRVLLSSVSVRPCPYCQEEQHTVGVARADHKRTMYIWATCQCQAARELESQQYFVVAERHIQRQQQQGGDALHQLVLQSKERLRVLDSSIKLGAFGVMNQGIIRLSKYWLDQVLAQKRERALLLSSKRGDSTASLLALVLAQFCASHHPVVITSESEYLAAYQRTAFQDIPQLLQSVVIEPWLLVVLGIGDRESSLPTLADAMSELFHKRAATNRPTIFATSIGAAAIEDFEELVSRRLYASSAYHQLALMTGEQVHLLAPMQRKKS